MSDYHYGDVFYIEKFETCGSEQYTNRPAVIVSNEINNRYSSTVEVVYMTTQEKEKMPTHVPIKSTGRDSTLLCEQISTIDVSRIRNYLCTLTPGEIAQMERALFASLGFRYISLSDGSSRATTKLTSKEDVKDLPASFSDLQKTYMELQSKYEKLLESKQRMNEELIRQRTAAKIFERVYNDIITLPQIGKENTNE